MSLARGALLVLEFAGGKDADGAAVYALAGLALIVNLVEALVGARAAPSGLR